MAMTQEQRVEAIKQLHAMANKFDSMQMAADFFLIATAAAISAYSATEADVIRASANASFRLLHLACDAFDNAKANGEKP